MLLGPIDFAPQVVERACLILVLCKIVLSPARRPLDEQIAQRSIGDSERIVVLQRGVEDLLPEPPAADVREAMRPEPSPVVALRPEPCFIPCLEPRLIFIEPVLTIGHIEVR